MGAKRRTDNVVADAIDDAVATALEGMAAARRDNRYLHRLLRAAIVLDNGYHCCVFCRGSGHMGETVFHHSDCVLRGMPLQGRHDFGGDDGS